MKLFVAICSAFLIAGCASKDYAVYVEAQKSLSRDNTMRETARLAALTEISKSDDPAVREKGVMLLQNLQRGSRQITIDPPKNWLGF